MSIEKSKSPVTINRFTTEPPSDSEEDNSSIGGGSPPQTQYELMRDNGFAHLQNLERDDLLADRKLKRRPNKIGDNAAAESGIIESITCFNFMCHERLHVELGPLINFVVGENGSGKSAVLTALTLCLGGKASDTNRGGSLKSFVKEGQDHGSLVVKLKNAGSDAYQHDVYGDSIIIERHFSKTGSSGFKIKTSQGRIMSTKKQEVDEISEWYALQIGNPLMVLSQDNARQFLNSATAEQKYRYFVSGVQLEQLDSDYKMSQDTLDRTLNLQDDLKAKVNAVKKDMEDAGRLAETVQKNQSLREKARHYRNQLVWSQVVDLERALEVRNKELEERDGKISSAEAACSETSEALTQVEIKVERAKSARQGVDEDCAEFSEKVTEADAKYKAAVAAVQEVHLEEREAVGRLKVLKKDMDSCEQKITEEGSRVSHSSGSQQAEQRDELTNASQWEKQLIDTIDQGAHQLPSLQANHSEANKAFKGICEVRDSKRRDIISAERQLKTLQESTGSMLEGFEPEMISLVKSIERDSGFEQKPLGPVGAYVRLQKPEWSAILEKTLGEVLNAFVVHSKRDQTRLSGMMRRFNMRRPPPLYIAYGGKIDTRSQEPSSKFDTILRVLHFSEEVIRSQLIINNSIEKVILVQDRREAEEIMLDEAGPPQNVLACICFHDGKNKRGHGLRITNRAGSSSTSPVVPGKFAPRMQSDSVQQVAYQQENLNQLGLELREIMSEERQARQRITRCTTALDEYKETTKKYETQLRKVQAEVEQLETDLDKFDGADGRLVALRAELEERREEEKQLGLQYGNMRITKRELGVTADEAKKALQATKAESEEHQARINKAAEKVRTCDTARKIAVARKNDAYERLDIEKGERQRAETKRDDQMTEIESFTTQARTFAPERVHVPENETHQSIEKKYEKLRDQLGQREKRQGASDEEINKRATAAKAKYEDVLRQTDDVELTIQALKNSIASRLITWRQFQRQISARVRIQFHYLLSERGFRGKVELDHLKKRVNLQIEPDETRKSSAGRSTKTLSGGEKSFSSICMLLSFWEAIGSPIRCLDEFDVFMDNVNRAISTNMLVSFSTSRHNPIPVFFLLLPPILEQVS